jgi:thiol-disulfide isomerase/thioredoxin
MKLLLLLFSSLALPFFPGFSQKIRSGKWSGYLVLEKNVQLPFDFVVSKNAITIINDTEEIVLTTKNTSNDSVDFVFPNFDSFLRISTKNKKQLAGYWYNRQKGINYKISFYAEKAAEEIRSNYTNISGKWEATFAINSNSPYKAIGTFSQQNNKVTGSFLTTTGDYRYLSGTMYGDQLHLSTFNGAFAFVFKATLTNNKLHGTFYSGNHYKTNWEAVPNNNFELPDADSITYVSNNAPQLRFEFPNILGGTTVFPDDFDNDNVTIIQLMGSWCPNCLDEAIFYKELLARYKEQGLQVVTICYEIPKTLEQKIHVVKRMADRNNLQFTFLIGGNAQKSEASQHFPMLNEVISFPTSLYLDKNGEIRKIHTGFAGPGTGEYYEEFRTKTVAFIEGLLNE